ncbi:glutathione s-transferase-like protein [Diaporthe amygdali]|uniref:glutathione s-transferase-like protein n=1 Tax=Phomopsis amygdali TaxID=1214568 RepID=UPI0022FE3EFB|nr:glutathione s-transferase-like protein [Diaporthe amygdali]KAJ0118515.1 glutathione s-transferase-like protein [Diaporthe amygdali]
MSSISAGRPYPTPEHANDDYVPSIDATEPEDPRASGREAPGQNKGATKPRFKGLDRRKTVRKFQTGPKENSLEIFEKVVRQQVGQEDLTSESASKSPAALEYYNDLARLKPMMRSQSIESCLEFFLAKVWHNVPFEGRNRLLKQRGTALVTKVAEAKMSDWDNEKLPPLAQTTQLFHDLGSLSCKKWADSVMSLIHNLVTRSTAKADYSDAEAYQRSMARKDLLLQDLIDTWIVFHQHRLFSSRWGPPGEQEWSFRFPKLDEGLLLKHARSGEAIKAINMVFPQIRGNDFRDIPMVAIASFVILADPSRSSLEAQEKAKPLLQSMGKVLAAVPIWKTGLQSIFAEHPRVLSYVLDRWDSLISQLRQTDRPKRRPESIVRKPEVKQPVGPSSKDIQQQVTTALGMGDADAAETAWSRLWGPNAVPSEDRKEEMQTMIELFHYFIMAFTALHRPKRAVEVWDSMTSVGLEPTVKTWTSLIEGCRRSKNAAGIENVWKKLLAAGIEVDEAAWSARVVGLIDCGEPEAGLRALDEMLHQSKLSIAPVNAAVSALIRLNAMSAAKNVLAWASQNHIEPNVMTFNTLLRPMVQQGNAAQVESLLKTMKDQGVEPDTATFTVLLEGLIGNSKDTDAAEVVKSVNELFDKMEAAGVEANMRTFARMIHLLLSEPGSNSYHAVEAIRTHIQDKGLRMSPYIHTILVDHYFRLNPPNLAAVEDLMNKGGLKWRMLVRRGLDRVFWERVIKGYAIAGEPDKAFEIFEQVSNLGSALTLDTLATLLQSLVSAGKTEEARKTVEIVRKHRENAKVSLTGGEGQKHKGRYWRHRFWAYAVECGLLSPAEWRSLEFGEDPFRATA